MNDGLCGVKYKTLFAALLTVAALYSALAALGASGSYSHAFGVLMGMGLAAWLGWMIRDCDVDDDA